MILDIKKLSQKISGSKTIKVIIFTVIFLGILSLVFQAGIFVGFHKAGFIYRSEFRGGHGAVGKIVKIDLPILTMLGSDNIEKTILIDDDTNIRMTRDVLSANKLTIDQYITVLGSPNDDGQIVAKFIRIIPSPNK